MIDFDPHDTPLPLSYFERKYQLSRVTLWRYRRAGLPTLQVGAKIFCRESDFVHFMEIQTASASPNKEIAK